MSSTPAKGKSHIQLSPELSGISTYTPDYSDLVEPHQLLKTNLVITIDGSGNSTSLDDTEKKVNTVHCFVFNSLIIFIFLMQCYPHKLKVLSSIASAVDAVDNKLSHVVKTLSELSERQDRIEATVNC